MFKVIIDTNVFASVFNPNSHDFDNFEPVRNCITSPRCHGILVYGGTKFRDEMRAFGERKRIFKILRDSRRLLELADDEVNILCATLKQKEPCDRFNDEHIIACAILSKCNVIVTNDKRADKYIKDQDCKFYPHSNERPKIYRYKAKHYKVFYGCCR